MPRFSYFRYWYSCFFFLTFVFSFFVAPNSASGADLKVWKNRDDGTFTAEFESFDPFAKSAILRDSAGRRYSVPVRNLSFESKRQFAWEIGRLRKEGKLNKSELDQYTGWQLLALNCAYSVIFFSIVGLFFLSYRIAAGIATGDKDGHFGIFLKMFVVGLLIFVAFLAFTMFFGLVFLAGSDSARVAANMVVLYRLAVLFVLIGYPIYCLRAVMTHYGIRLFQAIPVFLLWFLLNGVLCFVVTLAFLAIPVADGNLAEWAADSLYFKPVGLL